MVSTVSIGGRSIGTGTQPFVIAEAGVNHNGSMDTAHALIEAAARAGADAVKFQTFEPAALVAADAATARYQERTTGATTQRNLLDALALPTQAWTELAAHASDVGLMFLSTPFDEPSLELLVDLGVPAIKISSGDITNRRLLAAARATGLPLIVSTGASELSEVTDAVEVLEGTTDLVLMHCVTAYPAPVHECNLLAISTLRSALDCPVGWSDHTVGHVSAIAAAALGATVFEKHLTLDTSMEGPDHEASADPSEMAEYVRLIHECHGALGTGDKAPQASELENRDLVRRGLYAARTIEAGQIIAESDVAYLRPQSGVDAMVELVGMKVARSIGEGNAIRTDDIVAP